jgi:hypothetical protein
MPSADNSSPMGKSQLRSASWPRPERYFHSVAAVVLIAVMLTGFQRFFFAGRAYPDRPLTPPIRTLIILHGSAMALWMLVFLGQSTLILSGKRRLHARIGYIAAFLAAAIVILGLKLGIEAARVKPPGMIVAGLDPKQFMAIPVINVLLFGGFVTAGVLYRRRPAVHRAMMLLGTVAALAAAIARIDALNDLYAGTVWERIWGPFFMVVLLAALLFGIKCLLTRSLDRAYAFGCVVLALVFAADVQLGTSSSWDAIASALLRWTA